MLMQIDYCGWRLQNMPRLMFSHPLLLHIYIQICYIYIPLGIYVLPTLLRSQCIIFYIYTLFLLLFIFVPKRCDMYYHRNIYHVYFGLYLFIQMDIWILIAFFSLFILYTIVSVQYVQILCDNLTEIFTRIICCTCNRKKKFQVMLAMNFFSWMF